MGLHGSFGFAQDDAARSRIVGSKPLAHGNELQGQDTRVLSWLARAISAPTG